MNKAYFAIRDADGNEQVLSPFVATTPETKIVTESKESNDRPACVELNLKNVDEVLDYLNTHKDIITSGKGKVVLTIKPEKSVLEVYNN